MSIPSFLCPLYHHLYIIFPRISHYNLLVNPKIFTKIEPLSSTSPQDFKKIVLNSGEPVAKIRISSPSSGSPTFSFHPHWGNSFHQGATPSSATPVVDRAAVAPARAGAHHAGWPHLKKSKARWSRRFWSSENMLSDILPTNMGMGYFWGLISDIYIYIT